MSTGSQIGMSAANAGLGIAEELVMTNWRQKKQMEQQKRMQELQIKGSKEMADYNQAIAMDMWNKTNYEAQRKHMENANLSVGLMYGGSGGGGATTSSNAGNISSGNANEPSKGMAMMMGSQAAQAQAQTELTQAQTENVKADTENKRGVERTEGETRIGKLAQETQNAAVQQQILSYEKEVAKVNANIATMTQNQAITNIGLEGRKLQGEAEQARNAGKLSTEAYGQLLQQIQQNTIEQQLRMGLLKANIIKTGSETAVNKQMLENMTAQINKMMADKEQGWWKMEIEAKELAVKQMMAEFAGEQTEFNTGTAAQVKQITSIVNDIMNAAKLSGGHTPIGGFGR